jgi:hypothetical protein
LQNTPAGVAGGSIKNDVHFDCSFPFCRDNTNLLSALTRLWIQKTNESTGSSGFDSRESRMLHLA